MGPGGYYCPPCSAGDLSSGPGLRLLAWPSACLSPCTTFTSTSQGPSCTCQRLPTSAGVFPPPSASRFLHLGEPPGSLQPLHLAGPLGGSRLEVHIMVLCLHAVPLPLPPVPLPLPPVSAHVSPSRKPLTIIWAALGVPSLHPCGPRLPQHNGPHTLLSLPLPMSPRGERPADSTPG